MLLGIANQLMLLAALVLHGAASTVQQAGAAAGFLPTPATSAVGSFHTHGQIAHIHHDTRAGHIHHPGDHHHNDLDEHSAVIWSVGCALGIMPGAPLATPSLKLAGQLDGTPLQHLEDVDPHRLSRPPSTPSIA
jgi:hypothetical protein